MKSAVWMFLAACLSVLLYPTGALAGESEAETTDTDIESHYSVEAGDVLRILVWDEPELQSDVVVLPDNTISFPLVGVLDVNGKSISDIRSLVTERLIKFIPEAHVNVSLQQVRGSKYYVLGKVNRPGEFLLEGRLSVLQALSVAGGLSTFADEDGIKLVRVSGDRQISIAIDYPELLKGNNLEDNIAIESGDVVLVP